MNGRPQLLAIEILEDRTLMSTCHVTRLADTGQGTDFHGDLRYCINKVNAEPGPDVIDFGVTGTINLNSALPTVASDVDIQGPGADHLTVRRNSSDHYYRIFWVGNATVTISNLSITNGYNQIGGGIYTTGRLTLDRVLVWKNTASSQNSSGQGGGIYNGLAGVLTIRLSAIVSNGVSQFTGTALPRGAGIFNAGSMTIADSAIGGNFAVGRRWGPEGGGLYNTGKAVIQRTTINDNGVATSEDPPFTPVRGGGVYNSGIMKIRNSTIADNYGSSYFGIVRGGGFFNTGTLGIGHSTIASNGADEGGGIYRESGIVSLRNTLVGGNSAYNGSDIHGRIVSAGHNLIGSTSNAGGFDPSDILNVDPTPTLGPLDYNGGPTATMALLPGSPAIDAGDNTDAPEFDQRGPDFPRIVNDTIDIGAFEVQTTGVPNPPSFLAFLITADFGQNESLD